MGQPDPNYVLHPINGEGCKNGYETLTQGVLDGDINDFIKAFLMEFGSK